MLIALPVWQIAVRDYKFGKGKHSSLTKATYDAVGNRFRSLWGKEAGWAHSVLFTADLREFSGRLLAKTEVVELKVVKKEDAHDENGDEKENMALRESLLERTVIVKREYETHQEPKEAASSEEDMMSSIKRRRRTLRQS